MNDKGVDDSGTKPVAPGYPAIETLRNLDVSDWEPAAVFHPVELPESSQENDVN